MIEKLELEGDVIELPNKTVVKVIKTEVPDNQTLAEKINELISVVNKQQEIIDKLSTEDK